MESTLGNSTSTYDYKGSITISGSNDDNDIMLNVTLLRNTFRGNRSVYVNVKTARHLHIENNTFSCSTSKRCRSLDLQSSNTLWVRNNKFLQSTDAVFVRLHAGDKNGSTDIARNVFARNRGTHVVQSVRSGRNSRVYIHDNTFLNNSADATVLLSYGSSATVIRNKFDNPAAQYDVKVASTYTKSVVNATQNWWGSKNYEYVRSRIYDRTADSLLANFIFQPYITERNISPAIPTTTPGFFRSSTSIGGHIQEDTYLRKMDTPYVVSDEITVPAGFTLTIEAGTQLNFLNSGITVEGMVLYGSTSAPLLSP